MDKQTFYLDCRSLNETMVSQLGTPMFDFYESLTCPRVLSKLGASFYHSLLSRFVYWHALYEAYSLCGTLFRRLSFSLLTFFNLLFCRERLSFLCLHFLAAR